MATISNTPRPGYIFDSTDNCWYPIGTGIHSHTSFGNDVAINGVTVGLGTGSIATNTAAGSSAILNNTTGLYSGNYGSHESLEIKGTSEGNAYWPANTQTTDFATLVQATDCITGFRKVGASTNFNYSPTPYDIPASYRNSINASLFGVITGYSGGTTPSRLCNQIG